MHFAFIFIETLQTRFVAANAKWNSSWGIKLFELCCAFIDRDIIAKLFRMRDQHLK